MIPHSAILYVILKIKKRTVFFTVIREIGFLDDLPGFKTLASPHGLGGGLLLCLDSEQLCILLLLPHSQQYFLLGFVIVGLVYVCAMDFDQSMKLFSREREKKKEKTGWWWGMRWTRTKGGCLGKWRTFRRSRLRIFYSTKICENFYKCQKDKNRKLPNSHKWRSLHPH